MFLFAVIGNRVVFPREYSASMYDLHDLHSDETWRANMSGIFPNPFGQAKQYRFPLQHL